MITSSREHPFYVEGKGFVPAGGLAIGNAIVTRAGPSLVVKEVRWNRRIEGYDVFNFEVEDDHTYFVGQTNGGGAWVHNASRCLGTPYWEPSRYRAGLKERVWEAAKDVNGIVHDPVSGDVINAGDAWEMGHKPGFEFRRHVESAQARGLSRKEFLDEYHDSSHYQPEIPRPNTGHRGEGPFNNWPMGPFSPIPIR